MSRRWIARGALALGLVALPVTAQDEDGGGFLERQIEQRLSGDGFEVNVRGFEGALSSRATLSQLTIADEDGVWLTVNDVVLDWNRSALLRGRLSVDEFTAAEILLPRLPQGDDSVDVPSPEAKPFSLPDLPVSIQIGRIAAERVELGQPVLGTEAAIRLEGSASLSDGEGEVDIQANRLDRDTGSYAIAGSYENGSNELVIDLGIDEGEGGLVGSIIDLPGRPALQLDVNGEGPLSDFTAEIALQTAGEPRLSGTVSLREADGAQGFAVDLGGDIAPVFTPQYRPFFGPDIRLTATGARASDGSIRLNSFDLSARSLDLQGEVAIGPDGVPDLIDVTGRIGDDDGPVVLPIGEDIRVSSVDLDVQFDASQGDQWTGEIVVDDLDQPGVEIDRIALDGQGVIAGSGDTLDVQTNFNFDATGLAFDDGGVGAAVGDTLGGRLEIDYAAGQDIVMDVLRIAGAGFRLDGQGRVDPDGENIPVSLTARLDSDDLGVFSGLAGRPLGGGLSADLTLDATVRDQAFDVELRGSAQNLTAGIPQLDPLMQGGTTLQLQAERDEAGLRVTTLTVENDSIDLEAQADLTSSDGSATVDMTVRDLARIDPDLSGPATLSLNAVNPGDAWNIDLTASGALAEITADARISELDAISPLAQGNITIVARDLSQFETFVGRDLGGAVDVQAQGQSRFDLSMVEVAVEGQTIDIAIGQPELDRLLRGTTDIAARVDKNLSQIEIPDLDISNPQISITGDASIASENSDADLRIALPDLSEVVPSMSGDAVITVDATEDETGWNVDLDATGAGAAIAADALVTGLRGADQQPAADGRVSIAIDDLSVFSELARRDLDGSVDLDATGQARFDLSQAALDLTGTTRNLAIGQPELDRLLRGVTSIAVDARKAGDEIDVTELDISNPQISVTGDAAVRPENSDVDLTIALPDLSEVVPSMSGDARLVLDAVEDATGWDVDLSARGAGADITADARVTDLRSEDISPLVDGMVSVRADDLGVFSELARRDLGGSVDLDATGRARFDLSLAELKLNGTTRDVEIDQPEVDRLLAGLTTITADAGKDGDRISLPALSIENPQVSIQANGQYGPGENAVQAAIDFPDLGAIVPEMSGPGAVTLFAEEVGDAWQVSVDGDGAGVMLSAIAEVSDLTDTPLVDGSVELQAADLSRFSRIANRPLRGALSVDAEGTARIDGSRFDVTADAVADRLALGIAQVDQLLAGRSTLDVSASRDGPNAPIRVRAFDLDSPGLDATANGSILGGASNLTLDARLANLGQFVDGLNGPVTVQGRAGQSGSSFTVDVDVTGPEGINADISGRVAESFDNANLRIDGSAPLRLANPYIEPRSVTGQSDFNIAINGPLQLSSVSGTVTVSGGRFVEPSLPLVLEDLSATARLTGQSVQLNATARNQEGGDIRLSGPISLSGGYNADLLVELNNLDLEDPRLYKTQLDGRITVDGPLTGGARIAGLIQLDETELRIPSTGLGATGPIPDGLVHVNEPADVRRTRVRAGLIEEPGSAGSGGDGGVAYPLDIVVTAPNRVFVRGRGLDAELGGRLTLRGTTANVIPSGQFELIRGRLDLLGQRLNLTDGRITLQGDFTPFIRLVAETDTGDVTVRIVVEGDALNPEISFLSDPDLPEDEVLSRLLFGRSIDNISPLQAAQLASAVATLAGRGGDGVIANLRQKTGLDDLDVTTDDDGNVGLRAGKYLSENLYSDVTVGSDGDAEINLNLDLTDSITIRGGASNSGETSLGIFFERDY